MLTSGSAAKSYTKVLEGDIVSYSCNNGFTMASGATTGMTCTGGSMDGTLAGNGLVCNTGEFCSALYSCFSQLSIPRINALQSLREEVHPLAD